MMAGGKVSVPVRNHIEKTCREASVPDVKQCTEETVRHVEGQISGLCSQYVAKGGISSSSCESLVGNRLWYNFSHLKAILANKMPNLGKEGDVGSLLKANDGSAQGGLDSLIRTEVKRFVPEEVLEAKQAAQKAAEEVAAKAAEAKAVVRQAQRMMGLNTAQRAHYEHQLREERRQREKAEREAQRLRHEEAHEKRQKGSRLFRDLADDGKFNHSNRKRNGEM